MVSKEEITITNKYKDIIIAQAFKGWEVVPMSHMVTLKDGTVTKKMMRVKVKFATERWVNVEIPYKEFMELLHIYEVPE